MKALAILALLATTAHADSPDSLLARLRHTMDRQETAGLSPAPCTSYLAALRARGVPDTRTVRTKYGSPYLRAGVHALSTIRAACRAMEYEAKVAVVERAITYARDNYPDGLDACIRLWSQALAAGVKQNELDGTLEELMIKHCEAPKAMLDEGREVDPAVDELRRAMEHQSGRDCRSHLAALRDRGVPDSTTIVFTRGGRFLRRGIQPLSKVRVACEAQMHANAVDDMASVIKQAVAFPWVWAEECVQRWPIALASGVKPTEYFEQRVRSRRGWVTIAGTLEQLYRKHCENAYTPRRRNE